MHAVADGSAEGRAEEEVQAAPQAVERSKSTVARLSREAAELLTSLRKTARAERLHSQGTEAVAGPAPGQQEQAKTVVVEEAFEYQVHPSGD